MRASLPAAVICVGLVAAAPRARGQGDDPGVGASAPVPTTIRVGGRVTDSSGRPVRGATVTVENGGPSATTDRKGRFNLDGVAIGASLIVDAPGFETAIAAATGADVGDVVLLGEAEASEVINVSGQAPAQAPGAAKIDRTEITRVPGTGGDLVRTLTIMPGVVNAQIPLGSFGGIVIRGSAPEDSKILIDDFEVPILYHTIGFRSIVPSEAIDSLEYLPGGFDVSFGRAASGIVSLTTRAGGDARTEQAEISVIDGGLVAQGRSGADTRYMVAFRRSTIDLILPSILPASLDLSLTTVPRYYDEQLRIDHTLSPHWDLMVSSLGSDDLLELFSDKAANPDKRFYDRTRFVRVTGAARWHDGPWAATIATSGLLNQFDLEIGTKQFIRITPNSETTRAEVTHTDHEWAGLHDVVVRAGAEAAIGRATVDLALPQQPRDGQPPPMFNPNDTSVIFHGTKWAPDFAQWVSAAANVGPSVRVTAGARVDEFARSGDVNVQPRAEAKVKVTPTTSVRLSVGAYRRPGENAEEWLHDDLHPERATQTIAGVEYQPSDALRLQGSLYYTDRRRLITRDATGTLGNWGKGESYGGELLATYRGDPWFVWISGSLSRSQRIDYPGAMERLFNYDQPVSINAAASWKKGNWQLGARFQLYSGLPTTPVEGALYDSDANLYVPFYGPPNSERAPMHHQLDLRVDRSWKWGSALMTFFVDVQNVYLNQSVAGYTYTYDYSQRLEFKSLPIIPSLGLRGVL